MLLGSLVTRNLHNSRGTIEIPVKDSLLKSTLHMQSMIPQAYTTYCIYVHDIVQVINSLNFMYSIIRLSLAELKAVRT